MFKPPTDSTNKPTPSAKLIQPSSNDSSTEGADTVITNNAKRPQRGLTATELAQLPKLSHHLVDEARLNLLRAVAYLSPKEYQDVIDACQFGDIAHIKDKRKSGEPYITHPIAVAEILAGFHLDRDTIIAAILHDTVEDTEVTHEDLVTRYGEVVARLVDGVTKLKSSKHNKQQNKSATFHKILTATLDDPRVLIVKLADRLHNMSTLDAVRPEKQKATAKETLQFYVPFARIMGLNDIADYIEVLCYRNQDPVMYTKMSDKLLQQGLGRNFQKDAIQRYLTHLLDKLKLTGHVRVLDNKVNMYRQFFRNRGEMNTLLRQYAFEIVLDNTDDCYKLLEYLKQRYQIDDEHIEDNIRRPRPGGNQSMTLTYENENDTIKVTILTQKMQAAARLGVIGAEHASEVSQSVIQASLRNMKDIINRYSDIDDEDPSSTVDVIENLLSYLNERKILCYSPQGRAYELPRGATALDFAYAVGPMVGNIAVGANIDNKPAKLGTVVKNGQTVEIEVDKSAKPKAEWLGFVVTNKARRQLRHWLKDLSNDEQRQHGMQALDRALKTYDKSLTDLTDEDWQSLLTWRNIDDKNALFEQISAGSLLPQLVVSRLFSEEIALKQANAQAQGMQLPQQLLADMAGLEIDFAKCCNPIYGDPIMGHLSRDGLVLHRHKCYSLDNIRDFSPYQLFQLHWLDEETINSRIKHPSDRAHFTVYLKLNLALTEEQVSQAIYELRQVNIGVKKVNVRTSDTIIHVVVRSRNHLSEGIRALRPHLGFPNVARLYQYDDPDRNADKNKGGKPENKGEVKANSKPEADSPSAS
ncbi:RelA/SpoT family protein [Psychrobacter sp. I-STPA6b]|uniref:RelA/SpoT family protein n=1 Tax=Psychrobacter sp. I-STPA6b TaxID=2585718 RepID=UPI001D0C3CC3|nr:HD domain-containing protein [Psychrobacter sp. I-STPA6b]